MRRLLDAARQPHRLFPPLLLLASASAFSSCSSGPMAMAEAKTADQAMAAGPAAPPAPPAEALEREARDVPEGRERPAMQPVVVAEPAAAKVAVMEEKRVARDEAEFDFADEEMAGGFAGEALAAPADMGWDNDGDGLFADVEEGGEGVWFGEDEDWGGGGGGWGGDWEPPPPPPPEWSVVREFPAPNYSAPYDGPREDFRDTIYWNPNVQTDANGEATVRFYLSDAVTGFRANAEGLSASGHAGRGDTLITSKLPIALAVKLPIEVSNGDTLEVPITIANETKGPLDATLTASFGEGLKLLQPLPQAVTLAAGERQSLRAQLQVVGVGAEAGEGAVRVAVEARGLKDEMTRTLRIAPPGFPQEVSVAGTLSKSATQTVTMPASHIPGTLVASATLYPSPVASMIQGTESIIREPYGCFEQASSSNYPNIMVLNYLKTYGAEGENDVQERTSALLDQGYQLITGYESPEHGYEWFGGDPGHEALTAYGLMEFADMSRVYDVDSDMVQRTSNWLKSRRDGEGGYQRSAQALDSFGRADANVTNAYITYALTEAGESTELAAELDAIQKLGLESKDPYVMALAANALLNARPDAGETSKVVKRLARRQNDDGAFTGADHSITRSGGVALTIETTSLAAMALMKKPGYEAELSKAITFLNTQRDGWGGYGSTQSTVLALKAIAAYAERTAKLPDGSIITLSVNGKRVHEIPVDADLKDPITVRGIAEHLKPGDNTIEFTLNNDTPLPYSAVITWQSEQPATSPKAPVTVATALANDSVAWGESLTMDVTVTNIKADEGLPMTIARVGLPGGLTYQNWQLKELKEKGLVDFYETREREVVLYWRELAPAAVKKVPLELMSTVPGSYTGVASSAYLYYTDEHRYWIPAVDVTVTP